MKIHNKKRNSILVYEFLIKSITKALMEDDQSRQAKIFKIIRKRYKKGTELFKEFCIAKALYQSTVSSSAVAASVMSEAKNVVRALNQKRLEKEKSMLIKDINYNIGLDVYNEHVADYKILATIQTLFNEWNSLTNINMSRLAEFEDQVNNWMLAEKVDYDVNLGDLDAGTTRLVSSIMTKKLNEKYDRTLTPSQKEIVRVYAIEQNNDQVVRRCLENVKLKLVESIEKLETLDEKLSEVKTMLIKETLEEINDDVITRFMMYAKLQQEIKDKEGKN